MNTDRIQQLQNQTAYPDSPSIKIALMQLWSEIERDNKKEKCNDQCVTFKNKSFVEYDNCYLCSRNPRLTDKFTQKLIEGWVCIYDDGTMSSIYKTKEEAETEEEILEEHIIFIKQVVKE